MKFALDLMEKRIKPLFEKVRFLRPLYPLYEASETFAFTTADVTGRPPHVRDTVDMKRWMMTVVIGIFPCFLFGMFNAGHQFNVVNQVAGAGFWQDVARGALIVLPIVIVSYAAGGLWEVLFACVRKHEINEGFLVTGLLFPLTLPPTIPLWQVAVGISFGVVIGKEIFGGVGFNVLNPALTARAFLFFAYPAQLSGDKVWTKVADAAHTVQGFTGATSLSVAAAATPGQSIQGVLHHAGYTFQRMALGLEGGSIGETSALMALIGAVVLIVAGVGSWRIMAGGVLGLVATALAFNALPGADLKPFIHLPFYDHLVMGGFAFGIVYMATDPVSAAATTEGKWIYGFLIGALTVTIRVANPAFPEGVMLSILFMNVMAPLIDHLVLQAHIRGRERYLGKFRHA